jgi:penicillin-binding protein 1A
MMLAMRMENELTKDEIFELYLNKSFFGNRAYGVAAAAEFYYGKTVDQLTLDEMASLASIPKFPSSGNPITNPERAKSRRDYVLQRMRELNFISPPRSSPRSQRPCMLRRTSARSSVCAVRGRDGAQEMVAKFGGDRAHQGLPRHHHDRPGPADGRRPGDPRRPGNLRPPPRLARPGKAGGTAAGRNRSHRCSRTCAAW